MDGLSLIPSREINTSLNPSLSILCYLINDESMNSDTTFMSTFNKVAKICLQYGLRKSKAESPALVQSFAIRWAYWNRDMSVGLTADATL